MDGPGARYLAIEGRARVAAELDDEVYGAIVESERQQDPDRNGVAVIIDVDSVAGANANGYFSRPAPDPPAVRSLTNNPAHSLLGLTAEQIESPLFHRAQPQATKILPKA